MKTHTPGPWEAHGCTLYAGKYRVGQTWDAEYDGLPTPEMEANARLIASAPDLLRALEQLLETAESLNDWLVSDGSINGEHELFKKVRAIISKAKGEA
jgi:hypothetical protein